MPIRDIKSLKIQTYYREILQNKLYLFVHKFEYAKIPSMNRHLLSESQDI